MNGGTGIGSTCIFVCNFDLDKWRISACVLATPFETMSKTDGLPFSLPSK